MAEARPALRSRIEWTVVLLAILAAATAGTAWLYYRGGLGNLGPEQPIPFSHRVHATDKEIDCRFCHSGVDRTAVAMIPPVETCLFCHRSVITEHPEIRKLRGYADRGEPIPWVRVFDVPDHVYFSHRMHVRRGLECAECHGDVAAMDRIAAPQEFEMGFCIVCHEERRVSRDCVVCHR